VRELAEAFLERVRIDPTLAEAPKLVYLVGSTLVELGDRDGLRGRFEPMLGEYPDRGFSDGLAYWLGLADVLEGKFKPAMRRFEHVVADYPNGAYAEDAHYRMGVCWFGLLDYGKAQRILEGFWRIIRRAGWGAKRRCCWAISRRRRGGWMRRSMLTRRRRMRARN
jgi:tetratricopeptide (TPR) repeat protein